MTLEALRCFCAVVETGGFRLAAERVFRSQPAVSQQIKRLEAELGQTLFDRAQARPTAAGRALYARAQDILASADAAARTLRDWGRAAPAELRAGAGETAALYVLPQVVRRFAQRLPGTRLVLVNRSSDAVCTEVARGALDLGIVTLAGPPASELEAQPLWEQALRVAVPEGHPLATRRGVALADLADEPFLMIAPDTRTGALLHAHFARVGFRPKTVLDSGSLEAIKRYAVAGLGVAILPATVAAPRERGLVLLNAPGLPKVAVAAVFRRDAAPNPAAQLLISLLRRPRRG